MKKIKIIFTAVMIMVGVLCNWSPNVEAEEYVKLKVGYVVNTGFMSEDRPGHTVDYPANLNTQSLTLQATNWSVIL